MLLDPPPRIRWDARGTTAALVQTPPGHHFFEPDESLSTGSAAIMIPFAPPRDAGERIQFRLLEELVQIRADEVLRESSGQSYSPAVSLVQSPDGLRQWLVVGAACEGRHSAETGAAIRQFLGEMQKKAWSRDEFRRASRPLPYTFRKQFRDPDRILPQLLESHLIPAPADLDPAILAGMEGEVAGLARTVLDLENAVELGTDVPE